MADGRGKNVGFRVVLEADLAAADDAGEEPGSQVQDIVANAAASSKEQAELQLSLAKLLDENSHRKNAIKEYLAAAQSLHSLLPEQPNAEQFLEAIAPRVRAFRLAKELKEEERLNKIIQELEHDLDLRLSQLSHYQDDGVASASRVDVGQWYALIGRDKKALDALHLGLEYGDLPERYERSKLESIMITLYDLARSLEGDGDLERADTAIMMCRNVAEIILDKPEHARNRVWLFAWSARIKQKRGEPEAAAEFAKQAIQVEIPLDDDSFVQKAGVFIFDALSDATRRLITLKEDAAIAEGYKRRVEVAQRIAEVVGDVASWKRLSYVLVFEGNWYKERREQERYQESFRAAVVAAQVFVQKALEEAQKDRSPRHRVTLAEARQFLGGILIDLERLDEARIEYQKSFELSQELFELTKDETSLRNLSKAHWRLAQLADAAGDSAGAVSRMELAIALIDNWSGNKNSQDLKEELSGHYVSLSWFQLLHGDPSAAESAAQAGLRLTPKKPALQGNLLLAYLLQDRYQDAVAVFEAHKDVLLEDPSKPFSQVVLDDLSSLRKRGIDHDNFSRLEEFIESSQSDVE